MALGEIKVVRSTVLNAGVVPPQAAFDQAVKSVSRAGDEIVLSVTFPGGEKRELRLPQDAMGALAGD